MPEETGYVRWFDAAAQPPVRETSGAAGDRVDHPVYVYDERTVRAVNVAGVTGRPLLVEGPSGCGKTSLAEHIAYVMNWSFIPFTVTSRTQAGDLLYSIDQLKRLRDAQAREPVDDMTKYVKPGVLWKAFDDRDAESLKNTPDLPRDRDPFDLPKRDNGAVVLLDEIDKADPDVPNNLLLPLGSYKFRVDELKIEVRASRIPLVILTSNGERKLPDAFLRRCVNLEVSRPDRAKLLSAGHAHFPRAGGGLLEKIADLLLRGTSERAVPSTAEYIDTVRASISMHIDPDGPDWTWLTEITAWKPFRGDT
jgi:MoxR-like ATPase